VEQGRRTARLPGSGVGSVAKRARGGAAAGVACFGNVIDRETGGWPTGPAAARPLRGRTRPATCAWWRSSLARPAGRSKSSGAGVGKAVDHRRRDPGDASRGRAAGRRSRRGSRAPLAHVAP